MKGRRIRGDRLADVLADPEPDRGEVREATLAGVRWVGAARLVAESLAFVSVIALARLVPPEEYGRAAIVGIVWSLATGLNSQGFGAPLVQRKTIDVEDARATSLLALVFGLGIAVLTFFAVPPLVEPLFGGETANLFRYAAPAFLLGAIGIVPQAMLQRRLDFRRTSVVEMLSLIAGSVCSVSLAIAGLDAEAIVLGHLAAATTSNALLVLAAPGARPGLHLGAARRLGRLGLPAALSSVVYTGYRNLSYPIVGASLGAAATGFYSRAFTFGVNYPAKITRIMMKISFPAYSRSPSIEDVRRLRLRIVRFHAVVLFPLLALLIVVAPTAIPWLLGARWSPAVVPVQILAGSGMVAAVISGLGPLLVSLGRGKTLLVWDLANGVVTLVVVLAMCQVGLVAVCLGVLGVSVAQLVVAHAVLYPRVLDLPFAHLWIDLSAPATASLALAVAALGLSAALAPLDLPAIVFLVLVSGVGLLVYALVLRTFFASAWADLALVGQRLAKRRRRSQRKDVEPAATPKSSGRSS